MEDLSKEERNWISRFKRTFSAKPESLVIYLIDYNLTVCKRGVSSDKIAEGIPNIAICSGCVLTDIHDDSSRGE